MPGSLPQHEGGGGGRVGGNGERLSVLAISLLLLYNTLTAVVILEVVIDSNSPIIHETVLDPM